MKNKIFVLCIISLCLTSHSKILAAELCSVNGYTVITINGILNSKVDAIKNKDELRSKFSEVYNKEPLIFDYLYNPTHLAGVNDIVDVLQQGLFHQPSDYDLVEMLRDASEKVKTEKVLLVAHSQGNFYANNFYDRVTKSGVREDSIGVYGVGSPASRVAGGGRYITSDTDKVIATVAARYFKILSPNVHIPLKAPDGNGHSFSDVYLKYQGEKIISDIKVALGKLKESSVPKESPCIPSPELSKRHKIHGAVLLAVDPAARLIRTGLETSYRFGAYIRDQAANTGVALGSALRRLAANVIDSESADNTTTTTFTGTNTAQADQTEKAETPKSENKKLAQDQEILSNLGEVRSDVPKTIASRTLSRHSGGGTREEEAPPVTPEDTEPDSPTEDNETSAPEEEIPGEDVVPESEPESVPESEPDPSPVEEEEEPEDEPDIVPPAEVLPDLVVSSDHILPAGIYKFKNVIIENGAALTLEGDENLEGSFQGVKIIAENITIEEGGAISADGQGYRDGPGFPPGAGTFAGPSYAGMYGSAIEPKDLGTGGTGNFRGGGAIWLEMAGKLSNNGKISANGDLNSTGGSIYVTAKEVIGDGAFSANGGGVYPGASLFASGGGGRIAVHYETSSWGGDLEASGGCGSYDGNSLTCVKNGTVGFFDELNNDLYAESSWMFEDNDAPFVFNKINVGNGADITGDEDIEITAQEISIGGRSKFTLPEGRVLDVGSLRLEESSTLVFGEDTRIHADSIVLTGNSIITTLPEQTIYLEADEIRIDTGSSVSADGKGSTDGYGASDQGASYGGKGWGGVPTYGSETAPVDFGSGGYSNFRGGGAIRLLAHTLRNDGIITANGDATSSGGSIYATVRSLEGSGIFRANGGGTHVATKVYGPGGGGRIALHYETSSFSGKALALGVSAPAARSEAGTVRLVATVEPENPEPAPLLLPEIASYTFNGAVGDISIDPTQSPINLLFTANKNVDWVSIRLEREDDPSISKIFFSSSGCVDWTSTCAKTWNGALSDGGTAASGTYRIKVHIKDTEGNVFLDYLAPHRILVEIPEVTNVLTVENIEPVIISKDTEATIVLPEE